MYIVGSEDQVLDYITNNGITGNEDISESMRHFESHSNILFIVKIDQNQKAEYFGETDEANLQEDLQDLQDILLDGEEIYMLNNQQGGAVLGKGSFGTVFAKPRIPCSDETYPHIP